MQSDVALDKIRKLLAMAERARLLAKPNAAEDLFQSCVSHARSAA